MWTRRSGFAWTPAVKKKKKSLKATTPPLSTSRFPFLFVDVEIKQSVSVAEEIAASSCQSFASLQITNRETELDFVFELGAALQGFFYSCDTTALTVKYLHMNRLSDPVPQTQNFLSALPLPENKGC